MLLWILPYWKLRSLSFVHTQFLRGSQSLKYFQADFFKSLLVKTGLLTMSFGWFLTHKWLGTDLGLGLGLDF